ncbi:MAG: EamA family transporter [Alphaproteobacteria bacterium]
MRHDARAVAADTASGPAAGAARQRTRLPLELALLALLALLWGSSYLFTKVAVADLPPVTLVAVRVSVAALFLLAVLQWRGERLPRDRRTWGMLLVQAMLNSIVAWTVLAWGQARVDSGLAAVLNSTSPLWVFLISCALPGHGPAGLRPLAGVVLGLGGVVLIVGVDALAGLGAQVAGQLAALGGAVLYGGAAIYGRRFAHLPPAATAAGAMLWASAVLVPASLALDRPWTLAPSLEAAAAALALGVLSTGIALMLYFRLVRTLGSMGVASQAFLRAGVGVGLGVVLLGETVTPVVAAGVALAILGVALINWPRRSRR